MNFKAIIHVLGFVLLIEGAFMLFPFIVGLIYGEPGGISFLIMALITMATGGALILRRPKNMTFFAREGFTVTALSWIVMSLFGCVPFIMNGEIPAFTDALFETVSGFSTTGASILDDVEALSHASLFWRSFTHWIGGMGVLVFILALIPMTGGTHMNIMRAESPGPTVDKLLPKVRQTALALYSIYTALTVLEFIFLSIGGMPIFDAVTTAVGTAGTGGFGIKGDSMASYSPYIQWVVAVFMMLFGINFSCYFLIITRRFSAAFRFEEVRHYFIIILSATALIMIALIANNAMPDMSFGDKLRHVYFQVCSMITTTGFSTLDYETLWPPFTHVIIIMLMFSGACAGSTGGGIKVSRITTLLKAIKKQGAMFFHPNRVMLIKSEGKPVSHETIRSINVFFMSYMAILAVSVLIVSLNGFSFTTSFTAVLSGLSNIGPGLEAAGPTESFSVFSDLSKYVLIFDMIAGRLEIFPILIFFIPEFWKRAFSFKTHV